MWPITNSTEVFIEKDFSRFLPILLPQSLAVCGQSFLGAHCASFGTNTPREKAAQTYWNTDDCSMQWSMTREPRQYLPRYCLASVVSSPSPCNVKANQQSIFPYTQPSLCEIQQSSNTCAPEEGILISQPMWSLLRETRASLILREVHCVKKWRKKRIYLWVKKKKITKKIV